ncbi:MAG: hypothetical protein WC788_06750 [Candidatus Paceibacterota bacterium]|jgi:hypothetical protein
MEKQIAPFEWSLNYAAEKNKQYSQTIESVYFVMIIMFFVSPGIAILILVFVFILIGKMSRDESSASGGGAVLEKYKIDNEGVTVENIRNQRSHKYLWNELTSYCPYSVAKPLYGSFLKKYAGDDFMLERVGGSQIKLRAGVRDSAMVNAALSKKLKIKNMLNQQSYRSFRMTPLSAGSFNSNTMMTDKRNFNKPQKFSTSAEEKRFYEEKRYFEKNKARAGEQSFRNKIFAIYLFLMALSLVGYSIYLAGNETKNARETDGGGAASDTTGSSGLAGSEYIVRCNADTDCQYYFFATTDESGAMGAMPNLARVSDSSGCVWAIINRLYGPAWERQYPTPKDCALSSSIKNRKGCDPVRKVCVARK